MQTTHPTLNAPVMRIMGTLQFPFFSHHNLEPEIQKSDVSMKIETEFSGIFQDFCQNSLGFSMYIFHNKTPTHSHAKTKRIFCILGAPIKYVRSKLELFGPPTHPVGFLHRENGNLYLECSLLVRPPPYFTDAPIKCFGFREQTSASNPYFCKMLIFIVTQQ